MRVQYYKLKWRLRCSLTYLTRFLTITLNNDAGPLSVQADNNIIYSVYNTLFMTIVDDIEINYCIIRTYNSNTICFCMYIIYTYNIHT